MNFLKGRQTWAQDLRLDQWKVGRETKLADWQIWTSRVGSTVNIIFFLEHPNLATILPLFCCHFATNFRSKYCKSKNYKKIQTLQNNAIDHLITSLRVQGGIVSWPKTTHSCDFEASSLNALSMAHSHPYAKTHEKWL